MSIVQRQLSRTGATFNGWLMLELDQRKLERYQVSMTPLNRKDLYDGDIVRLVGNAKSVDLKHNLLRLDQVKSVTVVSQLATQFIRCSGGCSVDNRTPINNGSVPTLPLIAGLQGGKGSKAVLHQAVIFTTTCSTIATLQYQYSKG